MLLRNLRILQGIHLHCVFLQDTGSAYTSDLQVGQALVAVDGHSLYGLDHEKCVTLIARSFKSKKKAYVEFVILDSNQHLVV